MGYAGFAQHNPSWWSFFKELYFDRHRHGTAAAEAEGRQAATTTAPAQFMNQGDQHTRTAGADGVTEGNSATVYMHARPIPVKFSAVGQGLRGKGFVDLYQVEIVNLHACAL